MHALRTSILRHMEPLIVLSIFFGVILMNFLVVQKASFLNFYYLPTLVAGLVLGLRMAMLASILSVGFVVLFTTLVPERFALAETQAETFLTVGLWGGFLILTSYVVGLLHQRNSDKVRQLRRAYVGCLEILTKYVESSDVNTFGHSTRVSRLAAEVARSMGLSRSNVENCRVAGLLHDVGKIDMTVDVIDKVESAVRSPRTDETYAARGARMIDSLGDIFRDVVPIIEYQHAPYSEDGEINPSIPVEAHILAAADAYDSIVTDRPHRAGKSPEEALAELEKWSGSTYSPEVVSAFRRLERRLEDARIRVS